MKNTSKTKQNKKQKTHTQKKKEKKIQKNGYLCIKYAIFMHNTVVYMYLVTN